MKLVRLDLKVKLARLDLKVSPVCLALKVKKAHVAHRDQQDARALVVAQDRKVSKVKRVQLVQEGQLDRRVIRAI